MTDEWMFEDTVPPDAKFREELHRALEQTHRQQMAQRRSGARPMAGSRAVFWRLAAALILAIFMFGIASYLAERRHNSAAECG